MGSIYKITCIPTGKSYIGQTIKDPMVRIEHHLRGNSKSCRLFHNAIKEHGRDAFTIEMLHEDVCELSLSCIETKEIQSHNTLAPNGYNLTDRGVGRKNILPKIKRDTLAAAKIIGDHIRVGRAIKDMTQFDLARVVGIGDHMVSIYERGISTPPADIFCQIIQILDLNSERLICQVANEYEDQTD